MKKIACAVVALTAMSVWADVSVTGVKVQPRSPWNGQVDIEYTVACDDPNADVYVNPVAYDGDRRITLFPSSFEGDGATNTVKSGKHKMVWNAQKDFGAYACANFQLKIYAGKRLARYVKIDLSSGSSSTNFPVTLSCVGPDVTKDDCRTTELWLRLVPPGEFWMGSPDDELGREDNETLHHVTFTKPFYMGVFEVTQKQFELVTGDSTSSYFAASTNAAVRPVENTRLDKIRGQYDPTKSTGLDSNSFVSKLRSKAHIGGFDLPSESRWEYACRAGTMTALNNGKNLTDTTTSGALAEVAAYFGNSYADQWYDGATVAVGTRRVGSFTPNALGLYDMQGNVDELCRDSIFGFTWGMDDVTDPAVPNATETYKPGYYTEYRYHSCLRGGNWKSGSKNCRAGCRRSTQGYQTYPSGYLGMGETVGFRICCEAEF